MDVGETTWKGKVGEGAATVGGGVVGWGGRVGVVETRQHISPASRQELSGPWVISSGAQSAKGTHAESCGHLSCGTNGVGVEGA